MVNIKDQKIISIFGTSRAEPGDDNYELAFELGKLLGQKGLTIANGGYGGTMRAAGQGSSQAGGKVFGVSCSAFKNSQLNEYVTDEIKTAKLTDRLGKLIEIGDAYIVLPGGTGTLLELAEVWELKNKHFIPDDKPIILLGGFWRPLLSLIEKDDPKAGNSLAVAETPVQAVEIIEKEFGQ